MNSVEVFDFQYIDQDNLKKMMAQRSASFSVCFKICYEKVFEMAVQHIDI